MMAGVEVRIGSYQGDIANMIIYQIADYLSSAGTRLDTHGSVIDKEEYYPYGDSSLRTFTSKRFRYIGKEKDKESGLYQMGARYYSPWMCKFLSVDSMAAKYANQSSYCYGNCNPIFFSDPSGMEPPQQNGNAPQNNNLQDPQNPQQDNGQTKTTGTRAPLPMVFHLRRQE